MPRLLMGRSLDRCKTSLANLKSNLEVWNSKHLFSSGHLLLQPLFDFDWVTVWIGFSGFS